MLRSFLLSFIFLNAVFFQVNLYADNDKFDVFFKDEPLMNVIKFVSEKTGKNLIISSTSLEPKNLKVSFISPKPTSKKELYDGFLTVLDQNGLEAEEVGKFIVISKRGCLLGGYVDK